MCRFKVLSSYLIELFGKLYTYSFHLKLSGIKDAIFSSWIRSQFGSVGDGTIICRGCLLDGSGAKRISIGKGTIIQKNAVLGVWERYRDQLFSPELIIGDNCSLGQNIHISTINRIVIGDGLLTGRYVFISDNNHGNLSSEDNDINPGARKLLSKGEVIIGHNVWIGDKVTILSGVTIGDGCIIAANSVVTKSIPDHCMAAGVPAKIIKSLA